MNILFDLATVGQSNMSFEIEISRVLDTTAQSYSNLLLYEVCPRSIRPLGIKHTTQRISRILFNPALVLWGQNYTFLLHGVKILLQPKFYIIVSTIQRVLGDFHTKLLLLLCQQLRNKFSQHFPCTHVQLKMSELILCFNNFLEC